MKLRDLVLSVLTENEEARNDDNVLAIQVQKVSRFGNMTIIKQKYEMQNVNSTRIN